MNFRISPFVFRALALGWALAIVILSLAPLDGPDLPGSDKSLHFLAYFVLTLGLLLGFVDQGSVRSVSIVLASSVMLGAAVELLQPVTGRHRDLLDLAANVAGAAGALVIWLATRALADKLRARRRDS